MRNVYKSTWIRRVLRLPRVPVARLALLSLVLVSTAYAQHDNVVKNPALEKEIANAKEQLQQRGATFHPFRIKVTTTVEPFWASLQGRTRILFFKVEGDDKFLPLGDTAVLYHESDNNHEKKAMQRDWAKSMKSFANRTGSLLFAPVEGMEDALKHPTDFIWRGDDHGSANPSDLSYWEPVAPEGYVALGYVFRGRQKPDRHDYWVVKEEYTHVVARKGFFSDAGQGFKSHNLNLYQAGFGEKIPEERGKMLFLPPVYFAGGITARALILEKAFLDFEPASLNDQWWLGIKNVSHGSRSSLGLLKIAIMPYSAVSDLSLREQAKESPWYFFASEPYWQSLGTYSGGRTQEVIVTIGTERATAKSFRQKTGFSVTAEVGASSESTAGAADKELGLSMEEKVKVHWKVSTTYSREFETTRSNSTRDTETGTTKVSVNFPPLPPSAKQWSYWQRFSRISVYRSDGSALTTTLYGNEDYIKLQVKIDGTLDVEGSN